MEKWDSFLPQAEKIIRDWSLDHELKLKHQSLQEMNDGTNDHGDGYYSTYFEIPKEDESNSNKLDFSTLHDLNEGYFDNMPEFDDLNEKLADIGGRITTFDNDVWVHNNHDEWHGINAALEVIDGNETEEELEALAEVIVKAKVSMGTAVYSRVEEPYVDGAPDVLEVTVYENEDGSYEYEAKEV